MSTGLEVIATRCEFRDYLDFDYYDKRNPMPKYWHSVQPQETMQLVALTDVTVLLAKKDQEIEYLKADYSRLMEKHNNLHWNAIAGRKEVEALKAVALRQWLSDAALYAMPHECTREDHQSAMREHDEAHAELGRILNAKASIA